jgi:hypothetical protein
MHYASIVDLSVTVNNITELLVWRLFVHGSSRIVSEILFDFNPVCRFATDFCKRPHYQISRKSLQIFCKRPHYQISRKSLQIFCKRPNYQILRKSFQWEPRLHMQTEGQTDMTKLTGDFCGYAEEPINDSIPAKYNS